MINHRLDCNHPQTPAARRACREGRLVGQPTTEAAKLAGLKAAAAERGAAQAARGDLVASRKAKPATWVVEPKRRTRAVREHQTKTREIRNGNVIITQTLLNNGTWWNISVDVAPEYR